MTMPFKKIERRSADGQWLEIPFESLRKGDVFRVIDPPPVGVVMTPMVCLDDANAIVGEPENFGVNCMPEEFSAGGAAHNQESVK